MEHRKRIYIFLTFFLCTASLALLTVSLATHRWITARPIRTVAYLRNVSDMSSDTGDTTIGDNKFRGIVHFGLFQGTKVLNYGLGDRTAIIWLKQEMHRNPNMMSFGLWLLTILAVSIAMIFGLVAAIFAIINTVMTPIEAIVGVPGLYLWNALAGLFCMFGAITWLVQYLAKLSRNVMTEEEQQDGWTSESRTSLGFSYYIVVVALMLHLANMMLIYHGTRPPCGVRRHKRPAIDKHPEGLIMLY